MLGRSRAVVSRLTPRAPTVRSSLLARKSGTYHARYVTDSRKVPEIDFVEDDIGIYGQPTADLMKRAKEAGFKSMINLRFLEESGALPMEEKLAKSAGLEYSHAPFSSAYPNVDEANKAVEKVGELPKPILVHCAAAKRAAVIALAHIARRDKLTVDQTFSLMHKKNIDISPTLQQLLRDLVVGK